MKRRLEAVSREAAAEAAAADEGTGPDRTAGEANGRAPDSRWVKALATERVARTATLALLDQCMVEKDVCARALSPPSGGTPCADRRQLVAFALRLMPMPIDRWK